MFHSVLEMEEKNVMCGKRYFLPTNKKKQN